MKTFVKMKKTNTIYKYKMLIIYRKSKIILKLFINICMYIKQHQKLRTKKKLLIIS